MIKSSDMFITSEMISVLILFLLWQPQLGTCAKFAITNRYSQQLCQAYSTKAFGKVGSGPAVSSQPCPMFLTSGDKWKFTNCGTSSNSGSKSDVNVSSKGEPRIQNGSVAVPNSHPYIVYIAGGPNRRGYDFQGVIYNPYTIVTSSLAANLSEGYGETFKDIVRIQIGKHNITKREISEQLRFICDLSAPPANIARDGSPIYLIHLYDPITYNEFVGSATLFRNDDSMTISNDCLVAGWGKTDYDTFTQVLNEANVIVTDDCSSDDQSKKGFLCTPKSKPNVYCYGDLGAPLVCSKNGKSYIRGLSSGDGKQNCETKARAFFTHFNKPNIIEWIESEYKNRQEMCRPDY